MQQFIHRALFIIFILMTGLPLFTNAQDIIVLNNGDLIKSDVIEIGLSEIKYQRHDQSEGPVYSIVKSEIFAIHYKDGTRDIFSKGDAAISNINKRYSELLLDTVPKKENEDEFVKRNIFVHAGIGQQRIYSAINEIGVNNHSTQGIHWQLSLGLGLTTNTVAGFSLSKGSYVSDKVFIDDNKFTETSFKINQDIVSFSIWGKYYLKTKFDYFRPYGTAGLSVNRANVGSNIDVKTESDVIKFERGGRLMDIFPVVKAGVEFDLISSLMIYAEVGYDITLINIGFGYRLNKN